MKKFNHRKLKLILYTGIVLTVATSTFLFSTQDNHAEEKNQPNVLPTSRAKNKASMNLSLKNSQFETIAMNLEAEPRVLVKNGVEGTVEWSIDDQGVLIFGGGEFPFSMDWDTWQLALKPSITKVVFTAPIVAGRDLDDFFSNMRNLTVIEDLHFLDSSNTVNMRNMFRNCSKLTNVDVNNLNTSNVTNMENMFNGCEELVTLDLSGWDTSKVKNMNNMFSGDRNLKEVDVSNFNTSSVTQMGSMFSGCFSLETIDVANWDTSNVSYMGYMFLRCSSLTTLDVGNWNTSNLTNTMAQFSGCSSLENLDVSNWDVSKVSYMAAMFENCSSLKVLDVSRWNTANLYHAQRMFVNCSQLETLDVRNWSTSKLSVASGMFQDCVNLKSLDPSKWDTSALTSIYFMFSGCENISSLDLSQWNTSEIMGIDYAFQNCLNLENLNVSTWNTAKATTMSVAFANCAKLKSLDLSNWKTDQVYNMSNIFINTPLQEITIGPQFRFIHLNDLDTTGLNEVPESKVYTGKWEYSGTGEEFTQQELYEYDGTMPGTYSWQRAIYLLDYDLNGGVTNTPPTQRLEFGRLAQRPENPRRGGYSFMEWTEDLDGTTVWNFETNSMPANDITLYAQWIDVNQPITPPKVTDDGGPFTEDECGTIRDRWGNIMYQGATCILNKGYVVPKTGYK